MVAAPGMDSVLRKAGLFPRRGKSKIGGRAEDRYPLAFADLADLHRLVAGLLGHSDRTIDIAGRHKGVVANTAVEGGEHVGDSDMKDLPDEVEDRRNVLRPGVDVVGERPLVERELGDTAAGAGQEGVDFDSGVE